MNKTLHVVSLPITGGLEVMYINFLKKMRDKDPELFENQVIFVMNLSKDLKEELYGLGLPVHSVHTKTISKINCLKMILRIVSEENIDIVYGQNYTCNLLISIVGILRPKLKVVTHEHGTIWKTKSIQSRLLTQFWLTFSDQIICNSEATKIYIEKRFLVKKKKLKKILNGIPFRKKIDAVKKPFNLLFVGRLWDIKAVDTIIYAVDDLRKRLPEVALTILGDGPLLNELQQLVRKLELENHVYFHGYVNNVDQFMAEATLLVVPSVRESLGNVVLEAAFQETPAIVSGVDGLPEVVEDNKTGIIIKPTIAVEGENYPKYTVDPLTRKLQSPKKIEPKILSEKMFSLLNHPDNIVKMGKSAKKNVINTFSLERYVEEISQLIKQ